MNNKFFVIAFIVLGLILFLIAFYMASESVYETTNIMSGMTLKSTSHSGMGSGSAGFAAAGGCCIIASAILLAGNKKSS